MSFNPDSNKQATEALYSRKVNSDDQTKLTFNFFTNAHHRNT